MLHLDNLVKITWLWAIRTTLSIYSRIKPPSAGEMLLFMCRSTGSFILAHQCLLGSNFNLLPDFLTETRIFYETCDFNTFYCIDFLFRCLVCVGLR